MQVLKVRNGRVVGRLGSIIDKVEDAAPGRIMAAVLRDLYSESSPPPPLVLVEAPPPEDEPWADLLSQRRGSRVTVRTPQRGAKRRLMETARTNAAEAFVRHRMRRRSDHNARARDLRSLQTVLALSEPPLRIEAYDISTIQGRHTVGSMVVLEDGLPRRSHYRRFRIRRVEGQDDFASMEEVVRRPLHRLPGRPRQAGLRAGQVRLPALAGADRRGAGPDRAGGGGTRPPRPGHPGGGAGQADGGGVRAGPARTDRDPAGTSPPSICSSGVRDEAHRFALMYHRQIRGKRMIDSILDEVDGIGPVRKKALIKEFGSVKQLRGGRCGAVGRGVAAQGGRDALRYAAWQSLKPRRGSGPGAATPGCWC